MTDTTALPLCATLDLAQRVDLAEIEFCALAASLGGVERLERAGGIALFGKPGSPWNKVLGLGLGRPVSDADLDELETFYASRGAAVQIELCPLAAADVAPRLSARGYVLQAFENQLARSISPGATKRLGKAGEIRVTLARPDQDDLWVRVTAEGFAAFEPPVGGGHPAEMPSIEAMIEMMSNFAHPRLRRYLAWIGHEPAGGASAWSHDGVVGIAGTATLPSFRRRGVQTALTIAALQDAEVEADLVTATTAPGSTSQRTFERLGFQVLYTRAILIKSFGS